MRFLPSSLKSMIVWLILLTTLFPALFIIPWISNRIYTTERNTFLALQDAQNQHIRSTIESELTRLKSVLENKTDPLVIALEQAPVQQSNINLLLNKIFLREPSIHSIILIDPKGNFVAGHDRHLSIDTPEINDDILKTYFPDKLSVNSPFIAIPLHGREYISAISRSEIHSNESIFSIAIPVISDQDEVVAILITAIEPDSLWLSILKKIKQGNSFHYIVDRHGAYTHGSQYFKENSFATQYAIVRNLLKDEPWDSTREYQGVIGQAVFGVYSSVPLVNWGVISEIPIDAVLDPIKKNIYSIIIVFLVSALLLIVVALIAVHKIFSPLKLLINAFKDLEAGKYPKLPLSYFSELNILESGFNSMTHNRQEHEVLLEKSLSETEQARELAEQASEAKSQFLSSMSHELRTPLNAILGFSQILQDDESLTTEQTGDIQYIYDAGEHLLELINNVLDLAKIEVGQLTLSITDVSFSEVMQATENILKTTLNDKGIQLRYNPNIFESVTLKADAFRLKQVLLNLLSNAIKYNKPNGIISLDCQYMPGDIWRIEITDTGKGIAEDKINQLFTSFNRLGRENTAIEGTGIGLVITKTLVELMQGKIGVSSQIDVGTTFWFELKGSQQEITPEPINKSRSIEESISFLTPNQTYTVLYADDNVVNLLIVEKILSHFDNLQFISAEDGVIVLEKAEQFKPNLILLDIHMPNMTGNEACMMLKQKMPGIPVIAISADVDKAAIAKAMQYGFDDYLTKPFDTNKFIEMINFNIEVYNKTTAVSPGWSDSSQ
ncbi:MAG: response regulator [Methylomarinum sp.]|nr:response regulator [Methylomarinum sp.]